jgi:uncharacterized protein YlzI (FlbEa/FlbD family)
VAIVNTTDSYYVNTDQIESIHHHDGDLRITFISGRELIVCDTSLEEIMEASEIKEVSEITLDELCGALHSISSSIDTVAGVMNDTESRLSKSTSRRVR